VTDKPTLVIADDQDEIRQVLKRIIERDGRLAIIGEAKDGQQAISMVAESKPNVVILDLAMPNTNGMQAIPELLKVSPETRIVVFSSMAPFDGTAADALDLGASLVLGKDTPPRKLMKALLSVVDPS
jgi:DNA-binding NarL/FixJ family response regulator